VVLFGEVASWFSLMVTAGKAEREGGLTWAWANRK
jgi:hypothetical protein